MIPSQKLGNVVLQHQDKINEIIKYRNSYTPRTFFATIFDREGFYLPKADILSSLAIDPLLEVRNNGASENIAPKKSELNNSLPLHKYCGNPYDTCGL